MEIHTEPDDLGPSTMGLCQYGTTLLLSAVEFPPILPEPPFFCVRITNKAGCAETLQGGLSVLCQDTQAGLQTGLHNDTQVQQVSNQGCLTWEVQENTCSTWKSMGCVGFRMSQRGTQHCSSGPCPSNSTMYSSCHALWRESRILLTLYAGCQLMSGGGRGVLAVECVARGPGVTGLIWESLIPSLPTWRVHRVLAMAQVDHVSGNLSFHVGPPILHMDELICVLLPWVARAGGRVCPSD